MVFEEEPGAAFGTTHISLEICVFSIKWQLRLIQIVLAPVTHIKYMVTFLLQCLVLLCVKLYFVVTISKVLFKWIIS